MDLDVYENGVPSWCDLQTPDLDGAKAFYGALFGWEIADGPPEAGGYTMGYLRGRPVAGLGPQMSPSPPAWATYMNVDDADDVAAGVTANGGTVLTGPMDVMDVGRLLVFADPSGAVCGAWQPRAHAGAGVVNEPDTMCWNELLTTDVAGAKTFYGAVFGGGRGARGSGRLHRVEGGRPLGRRTDGQAGGHAGRDPAALGRLLRSRRHRCHGGAGNDARGVGDGAADGHRARPIRRADRSRRGLVLRAGAARGLSNPPSGARLRPAPLGPSRAEGDHLIGGGSEEEAVAH